MSGVGPFEDPPAGLEEGADTWVGATGRGESPSKFQLFLKITGAP